jgi:hypothetical protein
MHLPYRLKEVVLSDRVADAEGQPLDADRVLERFEMR